MARSPARPIVLVADDDDELRTLLVHVLEDEGYHVLVAEDGYGALAAASAQVPAVLVTDLAMPRCGGLEVLQALRDAGLRTRIVVLTSFADGAVEAEARRLGASSVVSKPFPLAQLLQAVHEAAFPTVPAGPASR
jgi:CheY-like chemotaxis protein